MDSNKKLNRERKLIHFLEEKVIHRDENSSKEIEILKTNKQTSKFICVKCKP
jgi:hypothetical protein